jgi:hypothetical protein
MEGRARNAELTLHNAGDERAVFRISSIQVDMDEGGRLAERPPSPTPDPSPVRRMFRFAPREIVLEPRDTQTVRIQVRPPMDLAAGEYRTNLLLQGVPPAPEPGSDPAEGVSIRIIPVLGLCLPIIYRHGETRAQVALAGLKLDPDGRGLHLRILRTGNRSVFGDLKVVFVPRQGPRTPLGETKAQALYADRDWREAFVPLQPPGRDVPLSGGRLIVTFGPPAGEPGALLAEAFLEVP